jgi:hypothetical protein
MIEEEDRQNDPYSLSNFAVGQPGTGPSPTGDPMRVQDQSSSFFSASDVLLSVPRGVVGAAKGIYNLADLLTFDLLPDWDKNPLGTSTSTVGGFVEVISEFAVGFLSGSAAISAVSKVGKLGKAAKAAQWLEGSSTVQKIAKGAAAGAIADFTVFEGDEMRLSNLIESVPALSNPITEFLAAKDDDVDSLTGRLKNVIEGGVIGTAFEGAVRGTAAAYRAARGIAAAADVVKQTRLAAQQGKSAEEVFAIRQAAIEKNRKWLEDVPQEAEDYLAQAEARMADEDTDMMFRQSQRRRRPASKIVDRVLLDSVRKRAGEEGLDREAAKAVEQFIEKVGPQLFDGTTLSVRKLGPNGVAGQYSWVNDVIKIAKDVYRGGGGDKTFVHEAWHMLSRYMDDSTVRRLNKDYQKAAAAFAKKHGIKLEDIQGKNPKELGDKIVKLTDSKGVPFDEAYAMTSLDEWFVWNMVRATEDSASKEGRKGVFWGLKDLLDNLVVSMRGKTAIEEAADKFLNKGMTNRAHRNLMSVYRRSLKDRVERPATQADFRLTTEKDLADSLGASRGGDDVLSVRPDPRLPRLTKDQLDNLSAEIPRRDDGSIDADELQDWLIQLRDERSINLLPILRGMGNEEAAVALDAFLRTGGLPGPTPRVPKQDQFEAARALGEVGGTTDEVVEGAKDEFLQGTARKLELQSRADKARVDLEEALKGGDNDRIRAAAQAYRTIEEALRDVRSLEGRRLQQNVDRTAARFAATSPEGADAAREILEDLDIIIDAGGERMFEPFASRLSIWGKTGLNITLELFRNSILSGVRTVVSLTTVGNLGGMFVNQGERAVGAWLASKILGRRMAKDMDTLATREGEVVLGYIDQVLDALFYIAGRSPRGPVDASGVPLTLSNARQAWRQEGMGVTLRDRAWGEGVERLREIDAQRLGLGRMGSQVDDVGNPIFEPSPFGHIVNFLGRVVNLPMTTMGTLDEMFSTSIARSNARMYAIKSLGKKAGTMTAEQIDKHVDSVMRQMFDESGRIYSRKAVEERAIKQAVREGLDPNSEAGKLRILTLVEKGDGSINFSRYDRKISTIARKVEARVRDATWKTQLDDVVNDPLGNSVGRLVGNLGKSAQSLVRNVPMAGLVLPFIRTPTNLIAWAVNRNPASLVWKGMRNDWYKGNPQMQAELMGRLVTSVGLFTAGTALATMGVITGKGPRDPAMRQQLRESGWQPYSIRIGDKWVSYARADPFSTIIGFVADLADAAHKVETGELDSLTDIAASLVGVTTGVITDKTFISGLTGVLNAISRPDLYGEQLVKQYSSALVPNVFAQALTPFSAELERSRSALDAMMMRIPGWGDDAVDKVRNPLGEPLLRDKGALGNVTDIVNPFSITTVKNDPLNQEFIRLGRAVGNPRRTLAGGVDLWEYRNSKGQTAYDRYQELASEVSIGGKGLRRSLMNLVSSRQYQGLPETATDGVESPRVGVVRSEIGRYRREAFKRLLQEFPELRARMGQIEATRASLR